MIENILLILILAVLCFIAIMIWGIGEHIAEETQKK